MYTGLKSQLMAVLKGFMMIVRWLFFLVLAVVFCGCAGVVDDKVDQIGQLEKRYGVEMCYEGFGEASWDSLKCDELGEDDMERLGGYLELFSREFGKYPPEFVDKTGLKRVYLCKNLKIGEQYRAAAPDYISETLYYDVYKGWKTPGYHTDVIHHEYYHMIEEQLNGDVYYKDPKWAAINPAEFVYGQGGHTVQGVKDVGAYVHPQEGFIAGYAMSGLEEDKASIFACLMTEANRAKIMEWSQSDKRLAAKIEYMKGFLVETCGDMERVWVED